MMAEVSMFSQHASEWLQRTLDDPDSHWFDMGHGETRDECLRLALREAVDWLEVELGPRSKDWAWGKLHRITFGHTLGRVPPLNRVFNRGPYPVGGDGSTVWATGFGPDLRNESLIGPPFRFIADLSDLRNSWGLLAPGQSGQLGSPHYDDQVEAWFATGYHPMLYAREDVEREAEGRLWLQP